MKETNPTFQDVYNFYEDYVFNKVANELGNEYEDDPGFMADVACVALNKLPCKYIRHHVDMAFYLTPEEYTEMESKIAKVVEDAVVFVKSHKRG